MKNTDCNFGILTSMFKLPNSSILFRNKRQLKTIQYSGEKKGIVYLIKTSDSPCRVYNGFVWRTKSINLLQRSHGNKAPVNKLDEHRSKRVSKRFNKDSKPVTVGTGDWR